MLAYPYSTPQVVNTHHIPQQKFTDEMEKSGIPSGQSSVGYSITSSDPPILGDETKPRQAHPTAPDITAWIESCSILPPPGEIPEAHITDPSHSYERCNIWDKTKLHLQLLQGETERLDDMIWHIYNRKDAIERDKDRVTKAMEEIELRRRVLWKQKAEHRASASRLKVAQERLAAQQATAVYIHNYRAEPYPARQIGITQTSTLASVRPAMAGRGPNLNLLPAQPLGSRLQTTREPLSSRLRARALLRAASNETEAGSTLPRVVRSGDGSGVDDDVVV